MLQLLLLEEIEALMWADLSVCDSTNDETDDSWFNISHEFHQCSSRQLISIVFGPANSINIQEPTSPKLPASVLKSRGKNYKIKQWEQRKGKAIPNKQHPVKTFVLKLLLYYIAEICIPVDVADTMLPCAIKDKAEKKEKGARRLMLLIQCCHVL
ncbi:hypothetical protein Hanom_Chr06g00494681 [Helianthus anomalus]